MKYYKCTSTHAVEGAVWRATQVLDLLKVWDIFANQSENFDSFATHWLLSLAWTNCRDLKSCLFALFNCFRRLCPPAVFRPSGPRVSRDFLRNATFSSSFFTLLSKRTFPTSIWWVSSSIFDPETLTFSIWFFSLWLLREGSDDTFLRGPLDGIRF